MNEKLNLIGKKLITKIINFKFDQYHKTDAKKALKNIESTKGKTEPKLIKLSDEYAKDIFGWQGYAPWLYVYSAVSETFKEGWIPDNYYGKIVVPAIKGDYGKTAFLSALSKKIFKSNFFPDIAYFINGLFYSNDYEVVQESNIKDFLFKNSTNVVFKIDNSLQGRGVYLLKKTSFDLKTIRLLGNGVFQDYIKQHSFFSEFMPNSVATLRLTTVHDSNGNFSVRQSLLRFGRNEDTHIISASSTRIPVNLTTGELYGLGYINPWHIIDRHPDTHVLFEKRKIPKFQKYISTALELHKLVPFIGCIGWDLIMDRNENIKVMEWNGYNNGMSICEATYGPCFSDLGWENIWREVKTMH
mgnify:CR=1 FL=1